jgi:uncharacterized protein YcaQ
MYCVLDRLSLFQIESVNVLAMAHYLPAFWRLGVYDRGELEQAAWGAKRHGRMFEYWARPTAALLICKIWRRNAHPAEARYNNGIDHLAHVRRAAATARPGWRDKRRQQISFAICHVGWIT